MMYMINRDDPLSLNPPNPSSSSSSSSPITFSDQIETDPTSQVGSASGSFQNEVGLLLGSGDTGSDADFGFSRHDFRKSRLAGTVEYYERHVFLCYKSPPFWPPRIEAAEFDRLPRLLHAAVMARKTHMKKDTRLTICEGHDGTETSNGDVLIFPDMVRYRRLTHFDVETFVEEVLIKDGEWLPGTPEALKGFYIFVCSHGSRDRRCGVCGPALVSRFMDEIELHGLQGKVSVSPCSHIGGHKYAGNVIIYGLSIKGKVTGHWYGYITPDDVPVLLQQHVCRGEIIDSLWRGQMGLSEEAQKKSQEQRINLCGETSTKRTDELSHNHEIRTDLCRSRDSCCCLGNGDYSLCQDPTLVEKINCLDADETAAKLTAKKNTSGISSQVNSGKQASRKFLSEQTWYDNWEREDTYAVLAVVCAAVSVAVAYHCYKQL